jgi:hypothetical protein
MRFQITFDMQKRLSHRNLISKGVVSSLCQNKLQSMVHLMTLICFMSIFRPGVSCTIMYEDGRSYVRTPRTETAVKNRLKVLEIPLTWRITDKTHSFRDQTIKPRKLNLTFTAGADRSALNSIYVISPADRQASRIHLWISLTSRTIAGGLEGRTRCGGNWGQGTHSPCSPPTQYETAQIMNRTCFDDCGFPLRETPINNCPSSPLNHSPRC